MKFYLNRKLSRALVYCLALLALNGIWLYHQPTSIVPWLIFLLLLIPTLFAIRQLWVFRQQLPDVVPDYNSPLLPIVQLRENHIVFVKPGYRFRHSLVRSLVPIEPSRITEVNPNTFPISFVLDAREVIFLNHVPEKELLDFAQRNGVPVVKRVDIWNLLCNPYLDTEFEKEEEEKYEQILENNGITRAEAAKIRRKIVWPMMLNGLAWEWVYLGLFDYLTWLPYLSRKRYWWCMEIALRNLKNTSSDS